MGSNTALDDFPLDPTTSSTSSNLIYLPTLISAPTPQSPLDYSIYREDQTPIIIDNGATTLRFGYATQDEPRTQPNAVAKYKERRFGKQLLLFGEGIDSENGARGQARTPWEGDVLLNFDALENALDYTFIQLGIDTSTVDHPILMTERLATPLHSRALTSELLFELYGAPSVTYAVDSLMSFYENNLPPTKSDPFVKDGLIISFNTASTSVVPMLGGKGIMSSAKRIPWGAQQATDYLLKLIQLKYPTFSTRVLPSQTNWMLQNVTSFSPSYPSLLRLLSDPAQLRAHERVVQFPFVQPAAAEEKSGEELQRIQERRREQGRKLQEMARKARGEKLMQKENELQFLTNLKEQKESESKREWQITLQTAGFDDDAELDQTIKKLETDLRKARKKEAAEAGDEPAEEQPSYPLVDVPDADLSEDSLREKRKQKMMKAGFEARMRARREKEKEREEKEAEEKREEEERERDLADWAGRRRREHEALMAKIKERNRKKAALNDRKSAASQARMKNIASLAADDGGSGAKKRRKGAGEDMFGADDADWAIYRKINTIVPSSDEEDDLNQLQAVEQKLLAHDPTFTDGETYAAITSQRSALMEAFRPGYNDSDVEGNMRIHLSTERFRVPETWFAPSMAGVDSAGLGEVLQNVLNTFSIHDRGRLVQNVFLTGSPSLLPGLIPRLHTTLRPILPPETPIFITRAADPSLDAWKGMAEFARRVGKEGVSGVGVSKSEYEEWGGERVKRWWGGNWNGGIVDG